MSDLASAPLWGLLAARRASTPIARARRSDERVELSEELLLKALASGEHTDCVARRRGWLVRAASRQRGQRGQRAVRVRSAEHRARDGGTGTLGAHRPAIGARAGARRLLLCSRTAALPIWRSATALARRSGSRAATSASASSSRTHRQRRFPSNNCARCSTPPVRSTDTVVEQQSPERVAGLRAEDGRGAYTHALTEGCSHCKRSCCSPRCRACSATPARQTMPPPKHPDALAQTRGAAGFPRPRWPGDLGRSVRLEPALADADWRGSRAAAPRDQHRGRARAARSRADALARTRGLMVPTRVELRALRAGTVPVPPLLRALVPAASRERTAETPRRWCLPSAWKACRRRIAGRCWDLVRGSAASVLNTRAKGIERTKRSRSSGWTR